MSEEMWKSVRRLTSSLIFTIDPEEESFIICGICRKILIDACQIICGCRFCRKCIEKYLQEGGRQCPEYRSVDCHVVSVNSMEDVHRERESNAMVMRLTVRCPTLGCKIKGQISEMITHAEKCMIDNGGDESSINHQRSTDITLRNRVALLEEEVKRNNEVLEKTLKQFNEQMRTIERKLTQISEQIQSKDEIVSLVTKKMNEEKNEDFIWKIEDYSQKKEKGLDVYSEAFYTRKCGYRLRLLLSPNGEDNKGIYISLYFKIVKGEFDDILIWPFKYDVTFTVMDQRGWSEGISQALKHSNSGNRVKIYQKPETYDNIGFGYPHFLEISTLESSAHLLKDDIIYIRCSVTK